MTEAVSENSSSRRFKGGGNGRGDSDRFEVPVTAGQWNPCSISFDSGPRYSAYREPWSFYSLQSARWPIVN